MLFAIAFWTHDRNGNLLTLEQGVIELVQAASDCGLHHGLYQRPSFLFSHPVQALWSSLERALASVA